MKVNLYDSAHAPTTTPFDRFAANSYNYSTNTTIFDSIGNPLTMTQYLCARRSRARVSPTASWEVHSYVGDIPLQAGGSNTIELTFDGTNALTSPTTATTFDPFQPPATARRTTDLHARFRHRYRPVERRVQGRAAEPLTAGRRPDRRRYHRRGRHRQGQLLER